jgi:hypothetical protein
LHAKGTLAHASAHARNRSNEHADEHADDHADIGDNTTSIPTSSQSGRPAYSPHFPGGLRAGTTILMDIKGRQNISVDIHKGALALAGRD